MRLFRFQHARGAAATFFPMSAIVKPILLNRADSRASVSNCKNVKKIAAILSM